MPVDFASPQFERAYSNREVTPQWKAWCEELLAPAGKRVVDLGCGGGIYARGFATLDARSVIGVDANPGYVEAATRDTDSYSNVSFAVGHAHATGLRDGYADIVYHRAVIHHLDEATQALGAAEMYRILRAGGRCVVQDRTMEDVESVAPEHWIRATLLERFPRLLAVERSRRPSTQSYADKLRAAGFSSVDVQHYAEVRKTYPSFAGLETEIMARRGKSILFELSDEELRSYCDALEARAPTGPIAEVDSWTIWLAQKT